MIKLNTLDWRLWNKQREDYSDCISHHAYYFAEDYFNTHIDPIYYQIIRAMSLGARK